MCLLAAYLDLHSHHTLTEVVADLTDDRRQLLTLSQAEGNISMTTAFARAYRDLHEDAQEVYHLIGVHPGAAIGAEVVAAVLGIERADAVRRLDGLADRSLATRENEDGSYHVSHEAHRHAAELARNRFSDSEAKRLFCRIAHWYLFALCAANKLAMPRRRVWEYPATESIAAVGVPAKITDRVSALTWLEAHRDAYLEVIKQTDRYGWHELTYHLADALVPLLIKHNHVGLTVGFCTIGLHAAQYAENTDAQVSFAKYLIRAHAKRGEFGQADELVALLPGLAGNDPRRQAAVLKYQAYVTTQRGVHAAKADDLVPAVQYWREAVSPLRQSVDIVRALGDRRSEGLTLTDLGEVYLLLSEPANALDVLAQAYEVLEEIDEDPYNLARIQYGLGRAHAKMNDSPTAGEYLQLAVEAFRADGAHHYVATIAQLITNLPQPH